jgi:lysophospholipase L1-like esterase
MASTITAATLTVTLTESVTLNGSDQGATNTLSIASVNEVSKRIVTATTAERIILVFGDNIAAGQFDKTKAVYVRITNLDDTNHVGLICRNENNDEFSVKLDKGQSFIYNGDLAGGVVDTMDAVDAAGLTTNTFADLVDITADADTASVDLEVFVASI